MGGDSSRMALEASLRSAVNDNALNTPLTAKLTGERSDLRGVPASLAYD